MIVHWTDKHGADFSLDTDTAPLEELRQAQRAFRQISHLRELMRICGYDIELVTDKWMAINDAIARGRAAA